VDSCDLVFKELNRYFSKQTEEKLRNLRTDDECGDMKLECDNKL
jgi:predicted secreted Zn-dependent protease